MLEGLAQLFGMVLGLGALAAAGALGVCAAGWIVYRRDGGRMGLWRYLRGI
jgi:hypothetical protein